MASREDLAMLSMEVYDETKVTGPYGWAILQKPTEDQLATGLYAVAYRNQFTGEIVIAYKGTTLLDTGDLGADVALTVHGEHPQFVAALEFADRINNAYGEQPGTIITTTGHSLGGGLAQLAADVFGFGGVTFDAPGMEQLTEGAAAAQFTAFLAANALSFDNVPSDPAVFSNLTVAGSVISSVGMHIGARPAPVQVENGTLNVIELMAAWGVSGGIAAPMLMLAMNQLDRHSMMNIYAGLREQSEQGQLLDRMMERFLVNGVRGYSTPPPSVWSFFESLFDGVPPLTQSQARAVIADMDALLATPLFDANHTAAQADLLRAQDRLKMAVQTLTVTPPLDLAQWTEAADGPRSISFLVTIGETLALSEQVIVVDFPDNAFDNYGLDVNRDFSVTGAERRAGGFEMRILAGRTFAVLTLTALGDTDVDDELVGRLQFTPQYRTDAEGEVTRTVEGLRITDAGEPAAAVFDAEIAGDLRPLDQDSATPGVQVGYDELGNVIVDPGRNDRNREDRLFDSAGNDRLTALGGNDTLDAWRGGDDRLEAGAGDDVASGAAGDDVLIGGAGRDILLGGAGNDVLFAEDEIGVDAARTAGETQAGSGAQGEWLDGGAQNDILIGAAGDDALLGGGGADTLIAGGGDDHVRGDQGATRVGTEWAITRAVRNDAGVLTYVSTFVDAEVVTSADGGADLIFGGAGQDWLFGELGDDVIDGGMDDDVLFGGEGNDVLFGQGGADRIHGDGTSVPAGAHGNDQLHGGADDDALYGNGGHDRLDGGAGADLLAGGAGDDVLLGGDGDDGRTDASGLVGADGTAGLVGGGGHDVLFGGAGNDYLFGDDGSVPAGGHGNDVLHGEAGADLLVGDGGSDTLDGGLGNDELRGGEGNDMLHGGEDDDILNGGAGADILDGGTGDDVLFTDAQDLVIWRAGDGSDTVHGRAGRLRLEDIGSDAIGIRQYDGAAGEQYLGIVAGAQTLWIDGGFLAADGRYGFANGSLDQARLMRLAPAVNLHGTDADDTFYGSDQDDVLIGDAGTGSAADGGDVIHGQGGADRIEAGAGNDRLDGGTGADTLRGGTGDDIYVVDDAADTVIEDAAAGNDTVETFVGFAAPAQVENVALGGAAALDAMGNSAGNRLFGNAAANVLDGRAGDDLLLGRGGDDALAGGEGADRLFGEDGHDRLDGGAGSDLLYGGAGDDVFVAAPGSGVDIVMDVEGVNAIAFGAGIARESLAVAQYQGDDGAQYLRIGYGGAGDAIVIRSGLAGVVHAYRFADGAVVTHADLVGQAPVPLLIEGTVRDDVMHGSGMDDRLDGGAGDDHIHGAAGNDALVGGPGADGLHGGAGDDVLDGGPGDDVLSGDAGADSYLLRWGMGTDLVVEDGVDPGTLALGPGVRFEDLDVWREANDLRVRFKGGTDGVRVRDYAAMPQAWWMRDAAGVTRPLEDLVGPPPATHVPATFAEIVEDYGNRVRALYTTTLAQLGYAPGADGVLRRTGSGIGTSSSGTSHYSAAFTVRPVTVEGGAYVQQSGPFVRERTLVSQTTTQVADYESRPGAVALAGGSGGGTARFYPAGGYAGFEIPSGATVVTVHGSSQAEDGGGSLAVDGYTGTVGSTQVTGYWIYGGTAPAGVTTRTVTHSVYRYDDTLTLEQVTGGDGDDTIAVQGHAVADGGAGNDVISASYPRVWGGPAQYSGARWESQYGYGPTDSRVLGAVLYGNAGDDELRGSDAHDTLIGGSGTDRLDGRAGADTYVVGLTDGWDVIEDTGQPRLRWGEVGLPTSPYSDWYYRSIGHPNYMWYGVDDPLPPLPRLQPNDYLALPSLIEAGLIETDTVEFAPGIVVADLTFSWGTHVAADAGLPVTTLDIAWAPDAGVRVVIPHSVPPDEEPGGPDPSPPNALYYQLDRTDGLLGRGIEQFRFADGSVLSMRDLLALAPPPPTFDPHRDALTLDGTDIGNLMVGTHGADQLRGLAGNDALYGGAGADRLTGGAGNDVIFGMAGDDTLTGGAGDDTLETGSGNDSAYGGAGNDILVGGDNAVGTWSWESLYGEDGDDLIQAGGKFAWVYGGSGNDELHGGAGFSILVGDDGEDTLIAGTGYTQLDGGAGADRMIGNALGDIYRVDDIGDAVVEAADGGVDTVISSISYVLAPGLENLGLTGAEAISATGNDGANHLDGTGNTAGNVLAGGPGDDTYRIDAGDTVFEAAGAGIDTVYAAFSCTLGENLEALQLVGGAAIDGRGNGLDNRLTGNPANNLLAGAGGDDELNGGYGNDVLDGGTGADRMSGGHGSDVYRVDNGADRVTELPGQGTDTVSSSVSHVLAANVERLTLTGAATIDGTGNAHSNIITGNGAANVLSGAAGDDTLRGLDGDDTLYGDAGADRLEGGAGSDALYGGAGDDTLEADSGWDALYGEDGNDTLTSGAGTAFLWGGSGDDTLAGGAGFNLLFGDSGDDVLMGGTGTFVLYAGAGNDQLTGGAADELLSGDEGDDILCGGAGTDLLSGGAGSDRYRFGRGDGQDLIADYAPWDVDPDNPHPGIDSIQLDAGIAHDQLWFARTGNDLQVAIIGTEEHVQVQDWYLGAAHRLDAIHAGDGYRLLSDQVEQLVQAMAGFAPPAGGEFDLPESYRAELEPVIAANWQAA